MDELFVGGFFVRLFNLIGRSGVLIRNGFKTWLFLINAKKMAEKHGGRVTHEYYRIIRKSILQIIIPIMGWTIFYVIVLKLFSGIKPPIGIYILIFVPLIPVVMGICGLIFVPMDEKEIEKSLFQE